MKKVFLLFSCLIAFAGFLLIIVALKGGKNPESELKKTFYQKEFSAIKIVNIVDTSEAVDAFGHKLKINEWYVQSNITRSVFPINTKSTNYTELGRLMANGKKEMARVQITNGAPLGAYVDVEILLLGDKRLVLDDLEQYQVVSIME